MAAKVREGRNGGVPNYVSGVDQGRSDVDVFCFGAAYLGPSYTPFTVIGDPNAPRATGVLSVRKQPSSVQVKAAHATVSSSRGSVN